MGGRDLHEPVAAGLVGRALTRGHQWVIGSRKRDAVDQHQLAGLAGHVEALPEAECAEETRVRILDELPGELGQLGVALRERGEVGQPLADRLRCRFRGPA